ncbi:hypothetical protein HYZ99_05045 [Candidatus Peregrinibacteria bacterium]|nr:hypothetical protein [Candidatus Peregrinibacteria bacterium]
MPVERESPSAPEPIEALHILVHPGFRSFFRRRHTKWNHTEEQLFDRFIEHAQRMTEHEIMALLTYESPHGFSRRVRAHTETGEDRLMQRIEELRNVLQRRLIILAGMKILSGTTKERRDIFRVLQRVATGRGQPIDPSDIETYVFGQEIHTCVPKAAQALNIAYRLPFGTVVDLDLTHFDFHTQAQKKSIVDTDIPALEKKYNRVLFARLKLRLPESK